MRKDVLLEFEYFPFIESLYNGKLLPAPFEFQSSVVVSPRNAPSRINRSVTSAQMDRRMDGQILVYLLFNTIIFRECTSNLSDTTLPDIDV